jgi:ribosomal protein L37AE/L43A
MTSVAQQPAETDRFEARCQTRLEVYLQRNQHRTWRCESCGEAYGAKHIYYNGHDCDECGRALEEVTG